MNNDNVLLIGNTINGSLGVATTHQYDALNRLTVNTQGNKRVDYAYNAISQVTNKKRYADITATNLVAETNHIYDSSDRLTNITHSKGANTISSYAQTYDAASKITSVTGTDGSSTYTYDNTNQLTGADYDFQTDESYTYDDNGNRTNSGNVTGVNNRLLEDDKYRYEYDIVGNRTKRTDKSTDDVTEYSWDIRDRLTGITIKDFNGDIIKSAEYTYDVYNQRIAKTVDADGAGAAVATTERYVYGRDQNIGLVFDENGNLNHRYLFGDGVDQIEADESNGNVLWALTDHLGSVRDVVDNSGTVLNHIVYDAFGGVTSQSNASVVFRYGYTARELDAESGLQYNRARYLDSFTGKFISEDPIGFQGGDSNLYRYVFNSPTNFTDSSGNGAERTNLYGLIYAYYRAGIGLGIPSYAVDFLKYALDNAPSSSWGENPGDKENGNSAQTRVKVAPDRVFAFDSAISKDLANTSRFQEIISRDVKRRIYSTAQRLSPKTSINSNIGSAQYIEVSDFFDDRSLNLGITTTLGNFRVNRYFGDVNIFRDCNSATFSGEVDGLVTDVYDFNKPPADKFSPINFLTGQAYKAQLIGDLAVYKVKVNFKVRVSGTINFSSVNI